MGVSTIVHPKQQLKIRSVVDWDTVACNTGFPTLDQGAASSTALCTHNMSYL
jgi:hypothetical protein